ncbi:MAG: TetR/AcrR family transcriptional regulator [Acidimicrobiales bacterium]
MSATGTRDRIVAAGAALFWRQGYTGTGMKQIVQEAEAPFGSVYHFFPGGKEELGTAVIRWSGAFYEQVVTAVLDGEPDIVTAMRAAFAGAGDTLRASGYTDACPIATVALEVSSTSEPMRVACAEVFDGWLTALAARFEGAGIDAAASRGLASVFLSLLEGAFILGRASRTTEALDHAGDAMVAATEAALARR